MTRAQGLPQDGGKKRCLKPKKTPASKSQKTQTGTGDHDEAITFVARHLWTNRELFMEDDSFQSRKSLVGGYQELKKCLSYRFRDVSG